MIRVFANSSLWWVLPWDSVATKLLWLAAFNICHVIPCLSFDSQPQGFEGHGNDHFFSWGVTCVFTQIVFLRPFFLHVSFLMVGSDPSVDFHILRFVSCQWKLNAAQIELEGNADCCSIDTKTHYPAHLAPVNQSIIQYTINILPKSIMPSFATGLYWRWFFFLLYLEALDPKKKWNVDAPSSLGLVGAGGKCPRLSPFPLSLPSLRCPPQLQLLLLQGLRPFCSRQQETMAKWQTNHLRMTLHDRQNRA